MNNYESADRMVSHPNHYIHGGIETIDVIESTLNSFGEGAVPAFLTGQVLKYISRWKDKNGLQDLEKAQWYLTRLINKEKEKLGSKNEKSMDFSEGVHQDLPENQEKIICTSCGHVYKQPKTFKFRNCPFCGAI